MTPRERFIERRYSPGEVRVLWGVCLIDGKVERYIRDGSKTPAGRRYNLRVRIARRWRRSDRQVAGWRPEEILTPVGLANFNWGVSQ